jgi:hypoxanthine-DNA glycosylase
MASKEKSKYQHVEHGFGPCFDAESRVLILGSFPSVKSREVSFYYGHPMNRFWPIMSEIFHLEIGKTTDDKRTFLHDVHLAVYDVIESCDIIGSSDLSIKNPVTTDIFSILSRTKIRKIFLNGKTAGKLFIKFQKELVEKGFPYLVLPSTSPANAATKMDDLIKIWGEALTKN